MSACLRHGTQCLLLETWTRLCMWHRLLCCRCTKTITDLYLFVCVYRGRSPIVMARSYILFKVQRIIGILFTVPMHKRPRSKYFSHISLRCTIMPSYPQGADSYSCLSVRLSWYFTESHAIEFYGYLTRDASPHTPLFGMFTNQSLHMYVLTTYATIWDVH